MKLTNILLLILISIISFQKFPEKRKERNLSSGIVINKKEVKEVKAISLNENKIKQSTTLREYVDSNGRNRVSLSQGIRVGKDYYVSIGVGYREGGYGKQDISGDISITKWW